MAESDDARAAELRARKAARERARYHANRDAMLAAGRARRLLKRDQYNAARRAKHAANPEHGRAVARAWAAANPGKRAAYCRKAWAKHGEKYRAANARWRAANPGRNAELAKAWVAANRTRYRATQNAIRARRYASDPNYRLAEITRARLQIAVRRARAGKVTRTAHLVGCDAAFLMRHLEAQFQPGMTWANYGFRGWHIDHVRPCASFDLTDPAQQRACFHYSNLQPLWAAQNLSKGAKAPSQEVPCPEPRTRAVLPGKPG